MADAIERTYNIPLRKQWSKAVRHRRAKRAIKAVRDFVEKNMKSENVLIGPKLNLKIWEHGMEHPPHHVKVTAVRDKEGEVRVELFGHKYEKKAAKEEKKGLADKLKEKAGIEDDDDKEEKEEKKQEKKEDKKPVNVKKENKTEEN